MVDIVMVYKTVITMVYGLWFILMIITNGIYIYITTSLFSLTHCNHGLDIGNHSKMAASFRLVIVIICPDKWRIKLGTPMT